MKFRPKTGKVNRKPREFEYDGATFYLVPLCAELHTTFSMYAQGVVDSYLDDRSKRKFVKDHVVDWSNFKGFDEKDEEVDIPYSSDAALEILLHPDSDELIMILYSQCLSYRNDINEEIKEDKPKAKK